MKAAPALISSSGEPESQRRRRVLLGILGEFLESAAGPLLIGASVYREPVDRNAVLFAVGLPDPAAARAPDTLGPTPPFQPPADLARLIASCRHADLLGMAAAGVTTAGAATGGAATGGAVFVDRWIAGELHTYLAARKRDAELADAHRRAAQYWQWRAGAWPQGRHADIHDLLEARQHLLHAGDIGQVNRLTGVICAQLRAWGDLGHETELIQATLDALPAPSAERGRWLLELAAIAQAQGDLAAAETRYLRAAKLFVEVGEAVGAVQGYESLSVLAHAQGDYRKAERHHRAAAHYRRAGPGPAQPASGPAERRFGPAAHLFSPAEQTAFSAEQPLGELLFSPVRAPLSPAERPSGSGHPPFGPAEPPSDAVELSSGSAALSAPAAPAVPGTGAAQPAASRARAGRPRRLRRPRTLTAGSLTLVALTAAAGALAQPADHSAATRSAAGRSPAGSSDASERSRAAAWVARQVSRSAVVACDPAMCAALRGQGLSAADLLVMDPGTGSYPLGSDIVVATAAVRSQFGARLAGVYAPLIIASFGTGRARIEIRVTAPDGSAAYQRAMGADLLARRTAGTELIGNSLLRIAPPARQALAGGRVDSRVLATIAALVYTERLRVIDFGDRGPGAGGGVPLRSAEVAATGPGAGTAALGPLLAFLRAQRPPYLAGSIAATRPGAGPPVLRFVFSEPTPLGLLTGGSSTS